MNTEQRKFWMVLGEGTPTYRHPSQESAEREAERLARMVPGQSFVVLEAVSSVCKSDVDWKILVDPDPRKDVPF